MKMRKLFSLTLAICLAASAVPNALAVDDEVRLPEPEITDDVQISDDVLPSEEEPEEILPPEEDPNPEEILPPDEDLDPEEILPPEEDLDPEEILPSEENPDAEEILPPEDLVSVVVPAVGEVILNPYRLPVATDSGETREQIFHQAQTIANYSSFPVTVYATATGSLASDAWFVTEPPSPDAPDKELFLYVEFQNSPDNWTGDYLALPNQLSVSEEGSSGDVMVLDAESEGYFRLFGAMSTAPESLWTSDNALTVTIAYTFIPENTLLLEPDERPIELEPPEELEPPVEPEAPEEPPVEPETPEEPEDPAEPETPEELEDPVEPETPEEPEAPVEPEAPEEPEDPAEPETPEELEDPVEPETPEEPEDPAEPETPEELDDPAEPEPPEEPPVELETPEELEPPEEPPVELELPEELPIENVEVI